MKRSVLVLALVFLAGPVVAQDQINLASCRIINAPQDVASWPITKAIRAVEFKSARINDSGVRLTLDPYNPVKGGDAWPDFTPPGWDGTLRYTLWNFVFINGQCYGSAFIEFWHDRQWTGAPLLTDYHEWAYANPGSPWGPMGSYTPAAGDRVGFMVTAGQHRMNKGIGPLKARSNVVVLPLVADGRFEQGGSVPMPVPDPTPQPVPVPVPPDTSQIAALTAQVAALTQTVEAVRVWADERFSGEREGRQALESRATTLEHRVDLVEQRKPVEYECHGYINLLIARIPFGACRIEPK